MFLTAAIRAYMSYAKYKDIQFWESKILKNENLAAYGYNALLSMNISCIDLEEYICELWSYRINNNWEIDVVFLMEYTASVRKNPNFIYNVLLRLKNEKLFLWKKVNSIFQQKIK